MFTSDGSVYCWGIYTTGVCRPSLGEGQTDAQCSLYMRELQDFIVRVQSSYLAQYDCKDFIVQRWGTRFYTAIHLKSRGHWTVCAVLCYTVDSVSALEDWLFISLSLSSHLDFLLPINKCLEWLGYSLSVYTLLPVHALRSLCVMLA